MKSIAATLKQHTSIILLILGIVLAVTVWNIALNNAVVSRQENARQVIDLQISEQTLHISNLAALTAIASADEVVSAIITDCQERNRFDMLLNKLSNTISAAELSELSRLFDQCANFYAHRRSIMAVRLQREVTLLAEFIDAREAILQFPDEKLQRTVNLWQEIAAAETEIAKHFMQLVAIQGVIITELQNGKAADSSDIVTILTDAREMNMQIAYYNSLIERNRNALQEL